MNIFEQLLFTTLYIECFDQYDKVCWTGTGFLLQRQVRADAIKIYLVSNRHVLSCAGGIAITFTLNENGVPAMGKRIRLPIVKLENSIVVHPNPNIDVAILECTNLFNLLPQMLYFKAVSYNMLADFSEPELSIAQNVMFVGYPVSIYDKHNNLPLIRTGMIASHPKYDFNGEPQFVIDAQVFPGSSGSPVYIDLTYENQKNGVIATGKREIKLLGIIAKTMIRNNELKAIPVNTLPVSEEVLGLGIVFKATTIKELIDMQPIDN